MVFDGRLDNHAELLAACGIARTDNVSLSALVSELYARDGHECVRRLTGDFRMFIYDERNGTLSASVDFACTRRLWWRERDSVVILASRIGDLYTDDESLRVNEDYLIERLATGWSDGREGPFLGALRLRPAESLLVSAESVVVRKYWCPTMFVASSRRVQEADCVAEFHDRFREAVARRLPESGAVVCDLSGGLDSSSVTTVAASVLGSDASNRLHAVTVSYPEAPGSDERVWAAAVARASGATHHVLEWGASEPVFGGMPENAYYWDEPRFNVHAHATAVAKHRLLQRTGARAVLSGAGAEAVLCVHMRWPVFLTDLLIRGRWRDVAEGVRRWHDAGVPLPVLVYRSCVAPLVRPKTAMTEEARRRVPAWLTGAARRRYDRLEAALPRPRVARWNTSGAWMAEQWRAADAVSEQGYGAHAYETRYPFLDKALVESVLRMPWSVRVQPRNDKYLLRRAAHDLLPAGLAVRRSLPADPAVCRAMAIQAGRVKHCTTPCVLGELGLVNPSRLQAAIALAQQGAGRGLRFLVTTIALELWTRSVLSGDWRRQQMRCLRAGQH